MPEQRVYHAPGIDLSHLGQALTQWFRTQGLETQTLAGSQDVLTVQARQRKDWRTYVAGSVALSVMATRQGDNLNIQMGSAKWADKVAGGVAALILFWPLAAFPAYGALKQKQIINDTDAFVQRYVASNGQVAEAAGHPFAPVAVSTPEPTTANTCSACGAQLSPGAKFCPNCGAKQETERVCAQCGAKLSPTAKFCEGCGAKVEG